MAPKFVNIGWAEALRVALKLTAFGAAVGSIIGFTIGLISPELYSLLLGGLIFNPPIVGFFLGIINGSFAGIVLGAAFLIACGIAQRGSTTTQGNPFSNYPRD